MMMYNELQKYIYHTLVPLTSTYSSTQAYTVGGLFNGVFHKCDNPKFKVSQARR